MGLNWSDILYPDNPRRREEVNRLAQSIRTSIVQIHANVRTVSLSLNQAYHKFQILPLMDLNLTYQAVFDNINAVLEQWKGVTKELEMDPSIPQEIKQLMRKFEDATSVGLFPDTVRDITNDPSLAGQISEPVSALIVGSVATYFIQKQLAQVITSSLRAVSTAGLLGSIIGAVTALLVGIIIGAIEGARERETLENLKREYEAMDRQLRENVDELESGVASVQRAIIRALP